MKFHILLYLNFYRKHNQLNLDLLPLSDSPQYFDLMEPFHNLFYFYQSLVFFFIKIRSLNHLLSIDLLLSLYIQNNYYYKFLKFYCFQIFDIN